MEKTTPSL